MSEDGNAPESQPQDEASTARHTVELPKVVLGGDEEQHHAPQRRVLPGLIDRRWLSYPAYIAAFGAGGIAVDFAIEAGEWAAGPVAIAWMMLFFWEWIYGVAYRYRRTILKYFAFLLVTALTVGLSAFCWERAEPQLVAASGQLVERGHVASLEWAAVITVLSGLLIAAHLIILGRGYREKRESATTTP